MPLDPSQPYVPQSNPNTNPFMGVSQGIASGVDWAHQQATVDLAKQNLQEQQKQHDEMKRQFNVKIGTQIYDEYNDVLGLPKGALKDQKLKSFKDTYAQAGIPINEDWIAAAKDQDFKVKWDQVVSAATGSKVSNPDAFNTAMENVRGIMGNKVTGDMTDKIIQGFAMAASLKTRNEAANERLNTRLGWQQTLAGQKDYAKVQAGVDFSLNGASRALSLIDNIEKETDPEKKIKANKQLRGILANEAARLVTQKSNFGEGTASGMQIDSFAARATDLFSQIKNEPEDTISPAFLKQEKNLYLDLSKEYMQAHDRAVNTISPEGTPVKERNAILGRAGSFQKQIHQRFEKYGGWQGEGIQGVSRPESAPSSDESAPAPASPAAADPQLERQAIVIKGAYDAASTPTKKALILKRAQMSFPAELLKKVGMQ